MEQEELKSTVPTPESGESVTKCNFLSAKRSLICAAVLAAVAGASGTFAGCGPEFSSSGAIDAGSDAGTAGTAGSGGGAGSGLEGGNGGKGGSGGTGLVGGGAGSGGNIIPAVSVIPPPGTEYEAVLFTGDTVKDDTLGNQGEETTVHVFNNVQNHDVLMVQVKPLNASDGGVSDAGIDSYMTENQLNTLNPVEIAKARGIATTDTVSIAQLISLKNNCPDCTNITNMSSSPDFTYQFQGVAPFNQSTIYIIEIQP